MAMSQESALFAFALAEGVTADLEGNVYGADFLTNVRKFVRKK
jgi:hypothetical protein